MYKKIAFRFGVKFKVIIGDCMNLWLGFSLGLANNLTLPLRMLDRNIMSN